MEQFFADYFGLLQDLHRQFVATFDGLPDEALDWVPGEEMNSLCVLVVHTTGSSRFWIGDAAMDEPSNRNRELEFKARGLSGAELQARFGALEDYTHGTLERITVADLSALRTFTNWAQETRQVTVGWALMHALEHTGLHLGHAQITRQLWEQHGL